MEIFQQRPEFPILRGVQKTGKYSLCYLISSAIDVRKKRHFEGEYQLTKDIIKLLERVTFLFVCH